MSKSCFEQWIEDQEERPGAAEGMRKLALQLIENGSKSFWDMADRVADAGGIEPHQAMALVKAVWQDRENELHKAAFAKLNKMLGEVDDGQE